MKLRFGKLNSGSGLQGSRVNFGTFHSIFFRVIRSFAGYDLSSILAEKDKYVLIKNIIKTLGIGQGEDDELIKEIILELGLYYSNYLNRQHILTDRIVPQVDLIKSGAGMDSRLIKFCVDSGAKGIVIEAMGRGNVPPTMLEGIQYAIEQQVAVVMVSRCPTGRVLDSYGYEGGGRHLRNLGVILGGDLPGQKARIKLMLALSVTNDLQEIKDMIEFNQYKK